MFPVAILAGGIASRLLPITKKQPKALILVAAQPFIYHQLALLKHQGIERVVLCVGHLGEQIEEAVGNGSRFGLTVDYSFDGDLLLGTGGALKQAIKLLGHAFFVLYGDSYLPCSLANIQARFEQSNFPALMTVLRNMNQWDRSNVLLKDGKVEEYNKHDPNPTMVHIDYGLGILTASVFDHYTTGQVFDLADVYMDLSNAGMLASFEVTERFYEIGSGQGIKETERFLLAKEGIK